jgi:hypothetical protein
VAACGSGGNQPNSAPTTHSAASVIGGAPSTASSAPASGGGDSGSGGSNTPTYPTDADSYGLAFLRALAQHDSARLTLLAVQSVVGQVADNYYNVNAQWINRSCGQDPNDPANPTKIQCIYDNANGDEITLVLNKSQLGAPTAVLSTSLEKTTYPADANGYVTALYGAYLNGNNNRVVRLSSSSVKAGITCKMAGYTPAPPQSNADGTTTIKLDGDGVDIGKEVSFTVNDSLLGHPYAVKSVAIHGCAP